MSAPGPHDGVDGWSLTEYAWDPETGLARIVYERDVAGSKVPETWLEPVEQPSHPSHAGRDRLYRK